MTLIYEIVKVNESGFPVAKRSIPARYETTLSREAYGKQIYGSNYKVVAIEVQYAKG